MHRFTTSIILLSLVFTISNAHNIIRIHSSHHHQLAVTVHATTKAAPAPAAHPPAAAASPPPPANLTSLMAKKSCKTFANLLLSTADAASTFQSSIDGGISIFCPSDSAMKPFMSKFKNLTADAKLSVLLFHAIPVYYSLDELKSNNGVMNTLATDGTAKNYNFTVQNDGDHITLKTAADSPAKITGTVLDKEPVAIYSIDNVLEPEELFAPVEAPAPAPASVADAPKAAKGKKAKKREPVADAPGPDADDDAADQKAADSNDGFKVATRWWFSAVATAVVVSGAML